MVPDIFVCWPGGGGGERVTRAYTVEVQTASVFYAQSLILLLFRSIDPLLSLVAVKHGHTISAVGVEPCTGGSTFQQAQDSCPLLAGCVCRILFFYCKAKTVQLALTT